MELIVLETADEIGQVGADVVLDALGTSTGPVLGLATGSSPVVVYEALSARDHTSDLRLSAVDAFALDEYVGLAADHPQNYATYLREQVVIPHRRAVVVLNEAAASRLQLTDYYRYVYANKPAWQQHGRSAT